MSPFRTVPHTGRGGWTWYTGSAGWMLRFILESLPGLTVESDRLRIVPCVPKHWASLQLNYRYRETLYRITVLLDSREGDGPALTMDGVESSGPAILPIDDRREHAVVVRIQPTVTSKV